MAAALLGFGLVIGASGTRADEPAEARDTASLIQGDDAELAFPEVLTHREADLYREIWKKRPGERISFRVLREEEALNLEVVSGNRWDFYRS